MVEPELQPVPQIDTPSSPNIQKGASHHEQFWCGRLDISFEDACIFNPFAASNASYSLFQITEA